MRNSTAYDKTFLGLGLLLGELLSSMFGVDGFADAQSTTLFERTVRTVLFFGIFSKTKRLLVAVIGPLAGNLRYLPFVVQPVLFLFVFPCLAHVTGYGKFFGRIPVSYAQEETKKLKSQ